MTELRVHGTCVAIEGKGALLRGASASGKSDLALRLIERGAQLVADDQVILKPGANGLLACAEPHLMGRLEVRGVGILDMPHVASAPLVAVFDLVETSEVPRLPEIEWAELLPDLRVRAFRIAPFEASAPEKVRLTLAALAEI